MCKLSTNFLPWAVLLIMKKLEIRKTKPTIVISTFKTDIKIVELVFFELKHFLVTSGKKISSWKKILTCANLALKKLNSAVLLAQMVSLLDFFPPLNPFPTYFPNSFFFNFQIKFIFFTDVAQSQKILWHCK